VVRLEGWVGLVLEMACGGVSCRTENENISLQGFVTLFYVIHLSKL
jgi:hypothetical protein